MIQNNSIILSGKYRILRRLGDGSTSSVFLAEHLILKSDCAIKVIPKSQSAQSNIFSEAQLLRSLQHPGIPAIYDFDEDELNYYIVEEYIPGESLSDYLLHQSFISKKIFFDFSLQLCSIFHYLHTFAPEPFFYQDLKPEHIIVYGNQLKLIDFGVCLDVSSLGNNYMYFGNLDFSAPEYISSHTLSVASDVYSIGKLIQFLSSFLEEPIPQSIHFIIVKSTHSNPDFRYETVEILRNELNTQMIQLNRNALLSNIAVIGNHHGCGSTHISIALTSILNSMGESAYYIEKNSHNLINMITNTTKVTEKNGCMYYKSFRGFANYGPGISVEKPDNATFIYDYGSIYSDYDLKQADFILLVINDSLWQKTFAIEESHPLYHYKDRLKIIYNMGTRKRARELVKIYKLPIHYYDFDPNPFDITEWKRNCFKWLCNRKGRVRIFSNIINHIFPPKK